MRATCWNYLIVLQADGVGIHNTRGLKAIFELRFVWVLFGLYWSLCARIGTNDRQILRSLVHLNPHGQRPPSATAGCRALDALNRASLSRFLGEVKQRIDACCCSYS